MYLPTGISLAELEAMLEALGNCKMGRKGLQG